MTNISKTIRLLMLLSANKFYSREELAERFEVSERTIYRYIAEIRNSGFIVEENDGLYRLLREDLQTKLIKNVLHFSESEVFILYQALEEMKMNSTDSKALMKKLNVLYDFKILKKLKDSDELYKIKRLDEAIKQERCVKLIDYRSSNSGDVRDRRIEPFELMPDYRAVWCFDLDDNQVKQFMISRMKSVEIGMTVWKNKTLHQIPCTDAFRMSNDCIIAHVQATLSLKAYNLLREEFPLGINYVVKDLRSNTYKLEIPVTDFNGIGRFVLGLPGEIIVESPASFRQFLKEKIKLFSD